MYPRVLIVLLIMSINSIAMSQSKVKQDQINDFFDKLESVGFFQYVKEKDEIETWKKIQRKGLTNYGWLSFPIRSTIIEEKTGEQNADYKELFEYYFLQISGDDMFRGSLKFYFEQAAKLFDVRNLNLEIGEEDMVWGEKDDSKNYHYFKHVININGKDIVFTEGNLNKMGAYTYIKKFTEIIKDELLKQNSDQQIVMITYQDGVNYLIADSEIISIFKNLPEGTENKLIEE